MSVDHFAITVPRSWFELPVEPERRDDRISALVQERIEDQRELFDHRTEIVRALRRFARSAWDSGARYCAAFAEPSEDGIVSGALTVTVLPAPEAGGDALAALTDHVAALGGDDDGMHVDVHEVPRVGRVPRVWGVSTVQAPDGRGSFDVVLMQTFVPAGDQVALVSVSSPATDLAEPLYELFETVTDTFELIDSATVGGGVA
ncbi:hypothetical protein [Curtobacterium sp. VKM Ac-1393]|uniref:hypothetical protein n=1 Tax=Curtobacterium sp. VKM Ac-1393 TaxID=2783814 RepID=UPI00188DB5A8|nr:hypothetical protein [Curtobacterium sp. VKM Ac-1393]MBF4607929.1 hypothetical protein [Curtobacterium sp. VKM Ac-1393]